MKPETRRRNPALEYQFGDLAMKSRLLTETAREWQNRLPHQALAESFREDIEVGMGATPGASMFAIASTIRSITKRRTVQRPLELFADERYELGRRNGRPFEDDYQSDRLTYLLFPLLWNISNSLQHQVLSDSTYYNLFWGIAISNYFNRPPVSIKTARCLINSNCKTQRIWEPKVGKKYRKRSPTST